MSLHFKTHSKYTLLEVLGFVCKGNLHHYMLEAKWLECSSAREGPCNPDGQADHYPAVQPHGNGGQQPPGLH